MPDPNVTVDLGDASLWFIALAAGAFLVTWVSTDLGGIRRTPYIAVLTVIAALLTSGYLVWSEAGASFWTHRWAWGTLAALGTGAILALLISRIPTASETTRGTAPRLATALWEAGVYGVAEGLLLSVLPVLIVWQWWVTEGWSDGGQAVVGGVVALLASVLVIVVHHLGYRTFRNRRAMGQAVLGCLILSVGYLLSGNPISAVGGHIILHLAVLRQGMELPPEQVAVESLNSVDRPLRA